MARYKVDKTVKNAVKPIDEPLKFIQENFNIKGNSYSDIVKSLEEAGRILGPGVEERRKAAEARKLLSRVKHITILNDFNKYNKFDDLTEEVNRAISSVGSVQGVYKVSDEIIQDINVARDWIASYRKYDSEFNNIKPVRKYANSQEYYNLLRNDLLLLGKSLLGRAVEMTPIDTGYLRSSGVLIDQGDRITVAFTAPYASYVHEDLEISHPWHMDRHGMQRDCGGQAKFLELALQEFFPDRHVWTEIHGYDGVSVTISINPLYIEYKHYN